MITAEAPAKINLALVVGGRRPDGLHEVATILQRIDVCDTVSLEPAAELSVEGFAGDTIVRRALEAVAAASGVEPNWRVRIEKRIPVAAGLGGGSSDAATAIKLACELLPLPLPRPEVVALATRLGVDVPFFLEAGPQLGTGTGTTLEPLDLPQDYAVLLVRPHGDSKRSTAEIYSRFERDDGFEARRALVLEVARAGRAADLGALPPNDLARSPLAARLRSLGAYRADVSGAGPVVYGLFRDRAAAEVAAGEIAELGDIWLTAPAW
jgi:4-diphosphocytidyl-2-C-methyl-D-erythritol kinase